MSETTLPAGASARRLDQVALRVDAPAPRERRELVAQRPPVGGGLAVVLADDARAPRSERRATMLQLAGLLAIALAIITYDRAMPYPGVAAVVPAIGTLAQLTTRPPALQGRRALFIAYATALRIDAGHECAQASAPRTPGPATRTCAAVPRPWT